MAIRLVSYTTPTPDFADEGIENVQDLRLKQYYSIIYKSCTPDDCFASNKIYQSLIKPTSQFCRYYTASE